MNWAMRLGQWLESRQKVSRSAHDAAINGLQAKIKAIEEAHAIPQTIAKEFALLKARLDRLELLTGLKREPAPSQIPGSARIG